MQYTPSTLIAIQFAQHACYKCVQFQYNAGKKYHDFILSLILSCCFLTATYAIVKIHFCEAGLM